MEKTDIKKETVIMRCHKRRRRRRKRRGRRREEKGRERKEKQQQRKSWEYISVESTCNF